jgi:glyoxylase-like metal-dependent hydrolase (beta-lactamase superfamily II)
VISGDALFQRSIGRTDLPGGDHELLLRSIRTKLLTLPDETKVYPATAIRPPSARSGDGIRF